ncbi:MAG TPA: hypothetical protein VGU66_07800 [Candidatus Elarobacter sp.]|nr:hypothetical protein [Candidatus Elarobacter sp.]
MPIELTTGQWISVAVVVMCVIAGVNALRWGGRWSVLCCGLIAVQSVASLVVPRDGAGHSMQYLVSVPVGITVLVILRRVSDEVKLARATQTGAAPESRP